MSRKLSFACWIAAALVAGATPMLAADTPAPSPAPAAGETSAAEEVKKLEKALRELEKRVMKTERKGALDRLDITGDFRFQAHSIQADVAPHFDGMALQSLVVGALFYYGSTGQLPSSPAAIQGQIASHYGDYLYFTSRLTFADLQGAMASLPPQVQQQLMGALLPATYDGGYSADNSILYTNRLRLGLESDLGEDVTFSGRLSMYKVFGDSTGVQVFDGSPTTLAVDGTTAGVPNSDILRVERAYFTWSDIGGVPLYLSIGRRPSTGGAPLHFRQDEMRGGTPLGSVIDYQFDGITLGYHLREGSTLRLCYGVGYESGFGNGNTLELPADRLSDAQFLGLNWDVMNTERTFLQLTAARAFDVTDGFNGLAVLPNDPLTGNAIGAPVVLRFSPSANLGDIDLASAVLVRADGPVDWFLSANVMRSRPEAVTTPFGGLFSDPFEAPEERSGTMWYAGMRFRFPGERTKLGLEVNRGSKYWFNFALAEDDLVAPKTSTRGTVWEVYLTHRITKRFVAKLAYIDYRYDWSQSGWHLGAPKDLGSTPVLGFPAYERASMATLGLSARF